PGEHAGGVLDGLAAAEVGGLRVDDHRVPAQLGDADLERDSGAQRLLLEDDGHGATPSQWPVRVETVRLEPGGQVEHLGLLGRAEVVVAQEVSGHEAPPASRAAGRAARNAAAWSAERMSG